MEQRQLSSRRIAAAISLETQACYWRALEVCIALGGILMAVFLGAKLLTGQLGSTRAVSPLALNSRLNYPVERDMPGQAPKRSPTQRDPFNARPAQLLDLFNLPSSTTIVGGVLAASVPLIVTAPKFYFLDRLPGFSTRATGEGSPKNSRAPPTR
jgi:hypothetical protein